jgi:Helix-turn-helix domain
VPDQALLTVQQVAHRLAYRKADGVRDLIHSGTLRAIDVSPKGAKRRTWRVDPADLDLFIATRKTVPPAAATKRSRLRPSAVTAYF